MLSKMKFWCEKGVSFVPHPSRGPRDGNPMYLFGPFSVYTSNGVMFMEEPGTRKAAGGGGPARGPGVFKPVDPKVLLARALAASGGKAR